MGADLFRIRLVISNAKLNLRVNVEVEHELFEAVSSAQV